MKILIIGNNKFVNIASSFLSEKFNASIDIKLEKQILSISKSLIKKNNFCSDSKRILNNFRVVFKSEKNNLDRFFEYDLVLDCRDNCSLSLHPLLAQLLNQDNVETLPFLTSDISQINKYQSVAYFCSDFYLNQNQQILNDWFESNPDKNIILYPFDISSEKILKNVLIKNFEKSWKKEVDQFYFEINSWKEQHLNGNKDILNKNIEKPREPIPRLEFIESEMAFSLEKMDDMNKVFILFENMITGNIRSHAVDKIIVNRHTLLKDDMLKALNLEFKYNLESDLSIFDSEPGFYMYRNLQANLIQNFDVTLNTIHKNILQYFSYKE